MENSRDELRQLLDEQGKLLHKYGSRIERLEAMVQGKQEDRKRVVAAKKQSVKEFLRLKKPITDVQKTLAIGYYLEKHEQMSSFNVDDLRKKFQAAKEAKPSNIHAFVNQNVSNGHMMDYDEKKDNKKAFVLTSSGERFVENGLKLESE